MNIEQIAAQICREVAELPDRNSPADWPEAMLVTHDELNRIVREAIAQMEAEQPVLIVEREPDYWSGGHFSEGRKPHIDPTKVWALPIGTRLYAHPQPTRGPLTEAESAQIVREASRGAATRRDGTTSTRIIRAVEAAHGITGEKQQ